MRRLLALALVLAAAAMAAALVGRASTAQGSSSERIDMIFDDARGLIGGQLLKIAGATAGQITNVVVTPDYKARIEATVDSRFVPFHQNATCQIRPEGLIAENYVDCDPGTAGSPPLKAQNGEPPTVPVENTSEPVSLLDLFNIFNLPTRERFQILINELGIGTAGEGTDFNAVLRRANPTLQLARQVVSILHSQQSQLATLVDATNTIAAQAATHTANLQSFLDRAAALATLTAQHKDTLSQAINRLPGLLAVAQPSLRQLDTVAVDGTPLLRQLQSAAPVLNQVSSDLVPFVAAAKPGLASLTVALRRAIPAIRDTTPLVATLRSYTSRSLPGTLLMARLLSNLQQHGFTENFLSVAYYIAASLSRFDSVSHMLPLLLIAPQNGACGAYATTPVPGCSAHYGQQPAYTPTHGSARAAGLQLAAAGAATPKASSTPAQTATPQQSTTPSSTSTTGTTTTTTSSSTQQAGSTLQSLISYLLK